MASGRKAVPKHTEQSIRGPRGVAPCSCLQVPLPGGGALSFMTFRKHFVLLHGDPIL